MNSDIKKFRFPGEFEKQEAIWLGWPVYENKKGVSSVPVYLEIIKVLTATIKVNLAVQDEQEEQNVRQLLLQSHIDLSNLTFFHIPHDDIWFRDMGPIFLTDDAGGMIIQKFNFNGWGYEALDAKVIELDQKVPNEVAKSLNMEMRRTTLVSEGGNRGFNGKGTMISTAAVEKQRNPNLSLDEIEAEFKKIFNLKKVIWLEKGLYDDDLAFDSILPSPTGLQDVMTCIATGGHSDEYCRFVSPDTVLLAEVPEEEAKTDPIAWVNHKRMEKNFEILKNSTDQDNKPLNIVRIPLPKPLFLTLKAGDGVYDYYYKKYKEGFILPFGNEIKVVAASSYNNFLLTNGAILAPKYWKPGLPASIKEKDALAHRILQSLFPHRRLHCFDVMALNIGGGGIHCITQQQPFINK